MSAILTRIERELGASAKDTALGKAGITSDPFGVLVSCIISLRTKDEVTDVVAPRLLAVADTPAKLGRLSTRRIEKLIFPAGFYRTKALTLQNLGKTLLEEHNAEVPDTLEGLLALKGVGRKTANLVITLGFGQPGICVDVHVHRISNRVGFVATDAPDETERVLRETLPRRWWIPINDLLVTWGRSICRPISPHCSICIAADLCPQRGVTTRR